LTAQPRWNPYPVATHVVYNKSYRHESEVTDRLLALVAENRGHVEPGSCAADEWNHLAALRDSVRERADRLASSARGPSSSG